MEPQITTLSNGLRVVTQEMRESYSATVSIAVGVGSRYENYRTEGGISHFLEHLMFKGTPKRPSTKIISEQIDAVGGFANAYTGHEMTDYYVKIPYQQVELALDILSDMLLNSKLDPTEIDRERGVVLEEMNVYRDNPARYVHRLTPKMYWPGHPLSRSILGSEAVIKRVSASAIEKYWHRYYRPSNMVVAVAGRVKHAAVVKLAERYLGHMEDAATPKFEPVKQVLSDEITVSIKKDTAQTHLVIGTTAYDRFDPKTPIAHVLTNILGGGLSSRLFLNIRENKGLAYSIGAGYSTLSDTGDFEVYAGVNSDKTVAAIEAIMEELKLITVKPVSQAEINKVKNKICASIQMSQESNGAVSDQLASYLILRGRVKSVEERVAEIEAVTIKQVQQVAAEMLSPERLRMAIITSQPQKAKQAFSRLVQ